MPHVRCRHFHCGLPNKESTTPNAATTTQRAGISEPPIPVLRVDDVLTGLLLLDLKIASCGRNFEVKLLVWCPAIRTYKSPRKQSTIAILAQPLSSGHIT